MNRAGPILLFDGVCNLCNGAVRFVLERDPAGTVRFASLQSDAGRALLESYEGGRSLLEGYEAGHSQLELYEAGAMSSLVLIENGQLYTRSTAALRLAAYMRAPWPALKVLSVVPRGLRDRVYDFVSQRRYRWFGRTDQCRLPTPAEASRFLG